MKINFLSPNFSAPNIQASKPAFRGTGADNDRFGIDRSVRESLQGPIKDTFVMSGAYPDNPLLDIVADIMAASLMEQVVNRAVESILDIIEDEGVVAGYITAFSKDKSYKTLASKLHLNKIEDFNRMLLGDSRDTDLLNEVFTGADIKTVTDLSTFLRHHNAMNPALRSTFDAQAIEEVKIYGLLDDKSYLERYGDFLLYLYNAEEFEDNPDFTRLNKCAEFLDNTGVKDSRDFGVKFADLKPKFNDFSSISDMVDAVEYLLETYDKKLEKIDEILAENPDKAKKLDSKKVYAQIHSFVDYLYEQNGGENLGDLSSFMFTAMYDDKLKNSVKKSFGPLFNDFTKVGDKINFYRILTEYGIDVKGANDLASRTVVSDREPIEFLLNYETLTSAIAQNEGMEKQDAARIYESYKGILNALYDEKTGDTTGVFEFLKIVKKFNIKNAVSFLDFYNRASSSKKKELTSDEVKNFVDLFSFYDESPYSKGDIFKIARDKKTTPVRLLSQEREKFLRVKDDIESYILEDDTEYFAGLSSREIYAEYGNFINEQPGNVSGILQNIAGFNVSGSFDYEAKVETLRRFEGFFPDRESLLNFISKNNLKFTDAKGDVEYIENCIDVLDTVASGGCGEDVERRLEYLRGSEFLAHSKKYLTRFLKSFDDEEEKRAALNALCDKKVESLYAFDGFCKKYLQEGTEIGPNGKSPYKTGIEFVKNLSTDVDFTRAVETVDYLQKTITSHGLPFKIDEDNILNIDIEHFASSRKATGRCINRLVMNLSGLPEDRSFVSLLPEAFCPVNDTKGGRKGALKFKIAQEIVSRADVSDESYRNLILKLHLTRRELGIADSVSDNIYTKAVEQALPDEFVEFVNSNEIFSFNEDKNSAPNFSLHAKLRLIDRFALAGDRKIEDLYDDKTKEALCDLVRCIYEKEPETFDVRNSSGHIVLDTNVNNPLYSGTVETVFTNEGKVVTIVPAKD